MDMDEDFMASLAGYSDEDIKEVLSDLPDAVVESLLLDLDRVLGPRQESIPDTPLAQAMELDDGFRDRLHLSYLSRRLKQAVVDVENGHNRFMLISMPPRMGKSRMTSVSFPLWALRRHPDWKFGLVSHSDALAISWTREVRRLIDEHQRQFGITLASDAGAAGRWETTARGGMVARSAPGQSITGLGFKVLLIDDAVRDFASAHSPVQREALWDWWTVNALTRLEPPYLVIAIGTRWHEDDLLGRFLSPEYDGNPEDWEVISFPALAEEDDVIGRAPGEPLHSPLLDETDEEALERWDGVRKTVGSYGWASLYQQRPAPSEGAIFDSSWWRYWTSDPDKATADGKVVYVPETDFMRGQWLDSWDCTFKGAEGRGDYVVGQRWAKVRADRFLVAQKRGRWTFTQTVERMKEWAKGTSMSSPYGSQVHQRLIEDAANGPAIIDTLKREVAGIKPVQPRTSKEARARAVTPEVESGNVFLPLPSDAGNEWVTDLVSELRNFPNDAHDDQVDAMTQALAGLRTSGTGGITVPGQARNGATPRMTGSRAQAARTDVSRSAGRR